MNSLYMNTVLSFFKSTLFIATIHCNSQDVQVFMAKQQPLQCQFPILRLKLKFIHPFFLGEIMLFKCRSNHFGILKGQFKG